MHEVWQWDIPGQVVTTKGEIYLDIETRKVPVPLGIGFPGRLRWQPFMVVFGEGDVLTLVSGDEAPVVREVTNRVRDKVVVYGAVRRDFDRYVLTGRFTNARRALLPAPGPWPAVPDSAPAAWVNRHRVLGPTNRAPDVPSRDVPTAWAHGEGGRDLVRLHCLRDVVELMMLDRATKMRKPARWWCHRFLTDTPWALMQVINAGLRSQ
jgi:hypothetical protein